MLNMFRIGVLSVCLHVGCCAPPQAADLGAFTHSGDVGAVKNAGSTKYDPARQVYEIAGSGTNMWFDNDEFQFVYRKMEGDFILRTRAHLLGEGVDPHRKIGWMIRSSLDADSPYVDVAVHGDGLTSMQFRRTQGADTEQVVSKLESPDVIQLARQGGRYMMSVAKYGDPMSSEELTGVDLGDEVYVGLFVCAHNADVIEEAVFRNVRVIAPTGDFRPYRDYIGSRLEVMELRSGHREIVHTVEDSLQAPNWTRDDKALIFNRNGLLYRFDLVSREVVRIDSGFANQNNNDHVISFDGTRLGISHHTCEDRTSVIYTMPIAGGTPKAITTLNAHSYFHSWSPDDEYLIYTAQRDGDFDIYRIPSDGGDEINLTKSPGLDDGSEYAPDGKTIYFNSSRSGKMQIWRMDANGENQRRVTHDEFNNWFPHLSPDGKSMVILSYDASIDPDDHPFYKHVYLRLLEKQRNDWSEPQVIAYLYGGQGSINVPSWSPDGARIAFVSNSDVARIKARDQSGATSSRGALAGERHRVLVSTDIGGTDPDDFQSMVHMLVYADVLDIEGLVASPYGDGRTRDILDVIDCYERDYANLKTYSDKYPTPDALRSIAKQGETQRAPYAGVRESTEGSRWIVQCARRDDPRPLHVLVWGGIEDLAQALHDAPDILPKLRVYWIGGPNKKWAPDAYQYIVENHPKLWIIESNATYRGWFVGGNQSGRWGNRGFVSQHIAGKGALGDFFVGKKSDVKMGDTPSVGWLLKGNPKDPTVPGWGGRYVRAWDRPYNRLGRMPTTGDRMEAFGILELALPLGKDVPREPQATLSVENQKLVGYPCRDGNMRFRFCPKTAKAFDFKIESNVPALDGQVGGITAYIPPPEMTLRSSADFPNWWTDDPALDVAEGLHSGVKTISRWREDFLGDFAQRMLRCQTPAAAEDSL